ncbi:MAG: hypothetical protein FWD15_05950 [Alphaproteobacteria bacterium]|nr:hypothetical protein [Alphaproteobacteria bacterium]
MIIQAAQRKNTLLKAISNFIDRNEVNKVPADDNSDDITYQTPDKEVELVGKYKHKLRRSKFVLKSVKIFGTEAPKDIADEVSYLMLHRHSYLDGIKKNGWTRHRKHGKRVDTNAKKLLEIAKQQEATLAANIAFFSKLKTELFYG